LCTTHGALFRVEDGHCLSGPCEGKRLTAIAIRVEGGEILLDDRE
jgi:nitrite reductase/ring-hydroxylating ferredoxin subunit